MLSHFLKDWCTETALFYFFIILKKCFKSLQRLTHKSVSRFYFLFTLLVCLPRWVHTSFFGKASLPGDCALMITLLTLCPKANHQQKLSFSSEPQSFPLEWSFLWLSKNEIPISLKQNCSRGNCALRPCVHKWLRKKQWTSWMLCPTR